MEIEKYFQISKVQVVLFFIPDLLFKAIQYAAEVSKEVCGLFDDDPNIISFPAQMPVPIEIPRIIFSNARDEALNISLNRLDLIMNVSQEADIELTVLPLVQKLDSTLRERLKLIVHRVAFVKTYTIRDLSVDKICNHYFSDGKLEGRDELNFSWHKSENINALKTNIWVRFNMSELSPDQNNLIIDMNSDQTCKTLGNEASNVVNNYSEYLRRNFENVTKLRT